MRVSSKYISFDDVMYDIMYFLYPLQDDVMYQYPDYDSNLVEIRGIFITLCHVMVDACGTAANRCDSFRLVSWFW